MERLDQIHDKIYSLVKKFPREELYALTDQLKRVVTSIPSTIAEGSGGSSKKDFSHYLDISIKSIYETVSLLYVAKEQGYITEKERQNLYNEAEVLVKKINAFRKHLK